MEFFFEMNDTDYSMYVNKLLIGTEHNYTSQKSPMGNEKITYLNSSKTIEVGIIPLDDEIMAEFLKDANGFYVTISYRDPQTNDMVEKLPCYIPNTLIEYHTIRVDKVLYKAFTLQIKELNRLNSSV